MYSTTPAVVADASGNVQIAVLDKHFPSGGASGVVARESGLSAPSVISLRLTSSRVDEVNALLDAVLPTLEADVRAGAIVSVDEHRVRRRHLPLS